VREIGKVFGLPEEALGAMASTIWGRSSETEGAEAAAGLDPQDPRVGHFRRLCKTIEGFPRHLSQHTGGFVITRTRLDEVVPILPAAMEGRTTIEWDKDDLDAPEDAATYAMISKADTVGVFQIESRAQMSMLPRLQPRTFYDLVIEVAIIRPGPIQGGMIHPYLRRRQGLEAITYPSADMEIALSRTLGVPIFQEQVMQIAMLAAGFSAGEADQLRRAMAAWKRKGGLEKFHERLIQGMRARGYTAEFAESIYSQIQGFAEYGFPESHAASFALLAYASAWLKCHHPAAFLAALLNSQPMGFYTPSQLVQDAKRHGVEVRPVDIGVSDWEATLEINQASRPAVRLGLNLIRGLSQEAGWRIEEARAIKQFHDLPDLAMRANLSSIDMQALAAANALHSLAGHRHEALWHASVARPDKALLQTAPPAIDGVILPEPTAMQEVVNDYRMLSLSLGQHPVSFLRQYLLAKRFLPASILDTFAQGQFARACGIVTLRQRPATAKGTVFITLEDETGVVNVIVWPSLVRQQRRELLTAGLLGVYGIWQKENNVHHLVAKRLVDLSNLLIEFKKNSRDFL